MVPRYKKLMIEASKITGKAWESFYRLAEISRELVNDRAGFVANECGGNVDEAWVFLTRAYTSHLGVDAYMLVQTLELNPSKKDWSERSFLSLVSETAKELMRRKRQVKAAGVQVPAAPSRVPMSKYLALKARYEKVKAKAKSLSEENRRLRAALRSRSRRAMAA